MPVPDELIRFTSALPYALRQDIDGYVRTLDAAWRDIYTDSNISPEHVPPERFLFVAGIWQLWGQVDGQRWVVHNSLEAATSFGASGISAGGFSYSTNSKDTKEVRDLRDRFRAWLDRNQLGFVIQAKTPRDLLWSLSEQAHAD